MRLARVLEVLGRDVPAAGDEDVLLAVGDPQEAVLVDRADVAGVEPAVGVEYLACGFLVLQVTGEDRLAPDQISPSSSTRSSKRGSAGPIVPKRTRVGRFTEHAVVHSVSP